MRSLRNLEFLKKAFKSAYLKKKKASERIQYKPSLMEEKNILCLQHLGNVAETISDLEFFLDFWNIRCQVLSIIFQYFDLLLCMDMCNHHTKHDSVLGQWQGKE